MWSLLLSSSSDVENVDPMVKAMVDMVDNESSGVQSSMSSGWSSGGRYGD
jgi:hypothetical protein